MNLISPSSKGLGTLKKLALCGGTILVCTSFLDPLRAWANAYLATIYLLTVAVGGPVFLALASVSGAGWHTAFRRIPEALGRLIPLFGGSLLVLVALNLDRFGWKSHGHEDPGTFWFKQYWLEPQFVFARSCVYILVWSLFAMRLSARSRRQDHSDDPRIISGTVHLSAIFLAMFALTFSLASVDWIMSFEPMWFSTIWGVYQFAGMFQATLAAIVLISLALSSGSRAPLPEFNQEHLHDLGKLSIGFSCFWMYIWFCQYMLIWYSNIPEETTYFVVRTHGTWGPMILLSLLLNGILPFFTLLPRPSKRSRTVMGRIAAMILVGRWVDLYTMVFPSIYPLGPLLGIWEAAAVVGVIGLGGSLAIRSFSSGRPLPLKDPYLQESLHYHAS